MSKSTAPIIAHLAAIQAIAVAGAEPPSEIMVFPAGSHTIHAARTDGTPYTGTVLVGPDTAQAMQAALLAHQAKGGRPYFDFDHKDERASARPLSYRWESGTAGKKPGVYAAVEWTAAGRDAVVGKDYSSFSPGFYIDEASPARVVDAPLNMGGLVNAPAFTAQAPIWAKRGPSISAATPSNETKSTTTMTPEEEKKAAEAAAAAAAAEAEKKKKEEEAAKAAADATAVAAKQTALEKRLAAIEAKAQAEAEAGAKAAVQAAVNRGALPAKDEAVHARWVSMIKADPSAADLLAKIPGNDVTTPVTSPGFAVEASAGLVEHLRGYDTERNHLKRAAIYARHIAPMFKPGFSLGPILAANSLGTLSGDLVVQRAFSLLKYEYPWLFSISTDFSSENVAFGQTVKTRLKSPLVANEFVPGTGYGTNNAGTTDVDVTIDEHWGVPVTFNVNELASTTRDLFGEQAEGMQSALAEKFVSLLLALITPTNFTNSTSSTLAAWARRPGMTGVARKLYQRKVPKQGRFFLLNPEFFEQLQGDSSIVQLAAYRNPEIITEYQLPKIAGFQPWQAEMLPTDDDLAGFAGNSESLAFATRVPNDYTKALPGASHGVVSQVLNPDTGITVQKVDYVDHGKAEATSRVALMFGVAVGNPNTGERLVETGGES